MCVAPLWRHTRQISIRERISYAPEPVAGSESHGKWLKFYGCKFAPSSSLQEAMPPIAAALRLL